MSEEYRTVTTARELAAILMERPDEPVELDNLPARSVRVFRSRKTWVLQAVRRDEADVFGIAYKAAQTPGEARALIRRAHALLHVDDIVGAAFAVAAAGGGIPDHLIPDGVEVAEAHRALHAANNGAMWVNHVHKTPLIEVPYPLLPGDDTQIA